MVKKYYQVCYLISDKSDIIEREFVVYKFVEDNYLKYVILTDTL